ncbi:MAG TPA: zf-HC2 domain-containing protein [Elusimicrobiota bacterium]|nr:zf-HC2 domain-containing protein [Elusimicrobiota bacterium]
MKSPSHVIAELSEYLDHRLSKDEGARVEKHLKSCEDCRTRLQDLRLQRELLRASPDLAPPESFYRGVWKRVETTEPRPDHAWSPWMWSMPTKVLATTCLLAVVVLVSREAWRPGIVLPTDTGTMAGSGTLAEPPKAEQSLPEAAPAPAPAQAPAASAVEAPRAPSPLAALPVQPLMPGAAGGVEKKGNGGASSKSVMAAINENQPARKKSIAIAQADMPLSASELQGATSGAAAARSIAAGSAANLKVAAADRTAPVPATGGAPARAAGFTSWQKALPAGTVQQARDVNGVSSQQSAMLDSLAARQQALAAAPAASPKAKDAAVSAGPVAQEWKGSTSGITDPRTVAIQTPADWQALWIQHAGPSTPLPVVDFSRWTLVGVFDGSKPSAGFEVTITSVKSLADAVEIDYQEHSPPAGAMAAAIITQPYDLRLIPKTALPVRFVKIPS